MSPKSGTAGTPVTPIDPEAPEEADKADPGEMTQEKARQHDMKAGKYSEVKPKPYVPPQTEEEKAAKTAWAEVKMIDESGEPVAGEVYRVELPDGTVAEGTLDDAGLVRLDGIPPGNCQISFPNLDESAWSKA